MGIIISTLDYTDEIKDQLKQNLDFDYKLDEEEGGNFTFFEIDFNKNEEIDSLQKLAEIIADLVIDKLEKKFITRIIKHKYRHFSRDERTIIQEMTVNNLQEENIYDQGLNDLIRKEWIIGQTKKYFDKSKDLNLEGFVRFRLKSYLDDLKFAVERAVDEFIIEKEYNEFVELLKYFVDLQEPRTAVIHVKQNEDGSFQIIDNDGDIIKNEYLEGYLAELFDSEVDYEDLLISALINEAPEKIVLHFDDPETEETVKKIFCERVTVCLGCTICQKWRK